MRVHLLIGTRKGGIIATSDAARGEWSLTGPLLSDQARMTANGTFGNFRSRDRGASWEQLTNGLPQAHAYSNVMRMAMPWTPSTCLECMSARRADRSWRARDGGDRWDVLFNWLPPIYSLETAVS